MEEGGFSTGGKPSLNTSLKIIKIRTFDTGKL
jgi:hypothetical protein